MPDVKVAEPSPRIESYGRAHCAIGYDMANVSFVAVDGGYVVIDTSAHPVPAAAIRREIETRIGGKPVAIIFTHSHPDHTGGASVFAEPGVPIWAQANFAAELELYQLFPNAYYTRGAKQFGLWLGADRHAGVGIGPNLHIGDECRPMIVLPTDTFEDAIDLTLGSVIFQLRATPGETHDQLSILLPEEGVVFVGDNIYQAFPNLYAIRGVPPRPVQGWIDSLDWIRRLRPRPHTLIPGHTSPVSGCDKIYHLLTDYRDAIAWVHDSVVRGINAGRSPDRLVREISLPAHLKTHPYLAEKYGTISGAVRGIYAAYVGWFDGEPANLEPLRSDEIAERLIAQLGEAGIEEAVHQAIRSGDLRWALWLTNLRLEQKPEERSLTSTKANILEQLGTATENALHRNWMFTEAAILRGDLESPPRPKLDADTVAQLPVETILRMACSRLIPARAGRRPIIVGYSFSDTGQEFTFYVRNGIGELAPGIDDACSALIHSTEADFKRVLVAGERGRGSHRFEGIRFSSKKSGLRARLRMVQTLIRLRRSIMRP